MFEDYRLVGAPDWINFERFDVMATLPVKSQGLHRKRGIHRKLNPDVHRVVRL